MRGESVLLCETCGAPLISDASFCEECGVRVDFLPAEPDSPAEIGERIEISLGVAAAISDRGLVHRRNDDAFHLETLGGDVVAVVCDGVSTSVAADVAARCAAGAAGAVLASAARKDELDDAAALTEAIKAAQEAVEELAPALDTELADPACTLVSALCREDELSVGWLGDSRAYWLTDDEAVQLTTDNSWATEQVAAGTLTEEQAATDPRARAITRWVGTDAPDDPPQIVTRRITEPGTLVLCSDGLWCYAREPSDLARLVRQLPAAASPLAIARWLADSALAAGGHDNITVAVIDVRPDGR